VLFFREEDEIGGDTKGGVVRTGKVVIYCQVFLLSEDKRVGRGCTGLVGRNGLIEMSYSEADEGYFFSPRISSGGCLGRGDSFD